MKITPEFTRLHSGENNSRILTLSIDKEYEGKKVKLGFVTPMGKIYITDELKITDNICRYTIPYILLDGKGLLLTQLIVYENEDYIIKSPIEEYPVFSSVDDMSAPTVSDESLKSLSLVFDILSEKSDIGHIHNDIYYTENEINALLSLKSDTEHKHEGVYLTKEELEALLPEAPGTPFEHNHDSRYYTENETDELLLLKQDKLPLTDYVVEQGSSGIWTYRKWASGIAECWTRMTKTLAINRPFGTLYASDGFIIEGSPFPFRFSEIPVVTVTCSGQYSVTVINAGANDVSRSQAGNWQLMRPTTVEETEYIANISAKGKWK